MKKSRFNEEQRVKIVREADEAPVSEVATDSTWATASSTGIRDSLGFVAG
jgi:hypothetical protein